MTALRRVRLTPKWTSLLDYLQLECLPDDVPCPYKAGDRWWVAFDGDAPVAFAGARPSGTPGYWYLCRAGVIPSARGQGLQKRLIRVRTAAAKAAGATAVITDTRSGNCASSNSLIGEGFRTYMPARRWALPDSIYWKKDLK